MLGSNVENCFIFEVTEVKIGLAFGEIVEDHLMVVICNRIMNWKVAVIVFRVQFWPDVLNDIGFAFDADNVFD